MSGLRVLAPAKINLHLRIAPPTGDGYHPLLSWMCTVGLFDKLHLQLDEREAGPLRFSCVPEGLCGVEQNLSARAFFALRTSLDRRNIASPATSIELVKRIPHGGGLGGGSSDAATTLAGLAKLWNVEIPQSDLAKIGATLGSDVPFFFHAPSAVCTGRGEIVRPTPPPACRAAVLILPPIAMPTPAVYKKLDEINKFDSILLERGVTEEPDFAAWANLSSDDLLRRLINDMEIAAFAIEPRLGDLRLAIERATRKIIRMSGSGSTLFTLCDTREQASDLAPQIRQHFAVRAEAVALCPVAGEPPAA